MHNYKPTSCRCSCKHSQYVCMPLVLTRCDSKNHDNTWTLPGGNTEEGDSNLLGAATREAMEELGQLPPFEVKTQILTK